MGMIIDTCILIDQEKNRLDFEKIISGREDEPFGISSITASELLHGVHMADSKNREIRRSAFVEKVLETFPIYSFDLSAARIYAYFWADLRKKGTPIGAHDLIISATALSLGFSVLTSNTKDFKKIEGLTVEFPTLKE